MNQQNDAFIEPYMSVEEIRNNPEKCARLLAQRNEQVKTLTEQIERFDALIVASIVRLHRQGRLLQLTSEGVSHLLC